MKHVSNTDPALPIVNIAAYRFAPLHELQALRTELLAFCSAHHLRGTILLSTEGINLFVAGDDAAIESLLTRLRAIPGLEPLTAKYSYTATQPFRRMLVLASLPPPPRGGEGGKAPTTTKHQLSLPHPG